ncbi:MAG: virulence factor SrfC family protein [Enterobacterales bacterium endosymbiont of Blomia tropicalis]|uniref:virulence factor SrfC family protein n=1 Tax=Mixta mediterraneensis TaxID=2758443 RepID=UPI0025A85252|nr:virulence factor SrfC family protein [Mixta mediterraneensis]MDL4915064.1 virulence factor SrfC family protein [Mixta mediterraneensis]
MKSVKPRQPQTLAKRLSLLQDALNASLDWIDNSRQHSPRLALEAETLTLQLRQARVQTETLAQQIARPVTLALFGQSQAGKAWLLREMVADAQGQLMTRLNDKSLNYFQHINPDNLDFAIATRFSHQREPLSGEWPVELALLSEAEILRLVITCGGGIAQPDIPQIDSELRRLQRHRLTTPLAGSETDALVSLWSWCRRHHLYDALLDRHFWPQAIELAPWLSVDDRVQLFSLLWPAEPALNEVLRDLLHLRHQLRNSNRVLVPLSVLTDTAFLPAEQLIVPASEQDQQRQIEVCPLNGNRIAKPQSVALGLLALLTLEVSIPLSSTPRTALYDDADMLELPAPGLPADQTIREERLRLQQQDPLRARLLEHKRALLPGFYAARQAIDLLLVCTAASQRQDASLASQTLRAWLRYQPVHKNGEKPRLIWAITPYDARHQQINVDEAVQRQIGQPGQHWGSMLALDRAGVDRMAAWLQDEMQPEARRDRLVAQLAQVQHAVVERRLQPWTEAEASPEQAARKQTIADTLLKCLQHRTGLHGELLECLQPPREALRQLWLNQTAVPASSSLPAAETQFGIGFEFDLFSSTETAQAPVQQSQTGQSGQQFPQQVFRLWLDHLRQLPENRSLLTLLNIDKATMEWLVEELITASFRTDMTQKLQQALHESDSHAVTHGSRADRQVTRAMTVLGDFVAWLGFLQRPEPERPPSRVNRGQPIFSRPPAPSVSFGAGQRLTRLAAAPANHTAYYIYDWLVGLNTVIIENNGYTGGSDLPAAAREALIALLKPLRS